MKKSLLLNHNWIVLIVVFSVLNISCKASSPVALNYATRTINIDKGFTGISTHGAIQITYTQNSKTPKAVISGPKEIVDGMTYSINSNGVLEFSLPKSKNVKDVKGRISIELNGGEINSFQAISSGSITVTTPVKVAKPLNFVLASSGEINILNDVSITPNTLNVTSSSSGKLIFQKNVSVGYCNFTLSSSSYIKINSLVSKYLNYTGSSVGILQIASLKTEEANLTVSSGGGIIIEASVVGTMNGVSSSGAEIQCNKTEIKNLSLSASSGSNIILAGEAENASFSASSGGDINVKRLKINKIKSRNSSSGGKIDISRK